MRTLILARDKQMQISSETMDLYAPLPIDLVIAIKNELEDLCFKTIDPVYNSVARKHVKKRRQRSIH